MKPTTKTAHQAIAVAWAILLAPAVALADGFLDDDLAYSFESGSDTEVYVTGLRNSSATRIKIPLTVVYQYTDGQDEDGNYIVNRNSPRLGHRS